MAYDPNAVSEGLPVDVTGSRVDGTVYQNTTGRPIRVKYVLRVAITTGAGNSNAYCTLHVGATNSFNNSNIQDMGGLVSTNSTPAELFASLDAIVPNNYYYRVTQTTSNGGFINERKWTEASL